ncbi:flagellar biosynthesis anti-sigma factor FlgM [Polaromonas sp.]|uniref:flagellar biosynthesis anti-sigma factor FlgM n=1 Tax=Polaromonas sp. TaxID=1869339 RepID=UPI003265AF55
MKIDQNVTFLKPTAGSSAPAASRNSVNAGSPVALNPAAAGQAQPLSPTPLLPSTHGDFDAARVAEIRESISAGRYHVNPGKIADGLLASVRDLLNSKAP